MKRLPDMTLQFITKLNKQLIYIACYQLLKIMDKEKIQKQIDKNRDLIEKALEMNDIEMMYYIVRRLSKDNERLIAKLKE